MDYLEYVQKNFLVEGLNNLFSRFFVDIEKITYHAYREIKTDRVEEFVTLHFIGGGVCYANNNINSYSATARNVCNMLDGGVYQNIDFYRELIKGKDGWEKIEL